MRDLFENELKFVSGAGSSPTPPSGSGCSPTPPAPRAKGNNGFGNGSDAPNLDAPGNSGSTGGGKAGSVGDSRGPR
jgi:hypothetical protein